jgi:hypothetical protein
VRRALTTHQSGQFNWSFIFLGANIDAVDVGRRMAVPQATAMPTSPHDAYPVARTFDAASRGIGRGRTGLAMGFSDDDRREASATPGGDCPVALGEALILLHQNVRR